MSNPTNTNRIQILNQFIDHRGNLYTPGIYEPNTLLLKSLIRANYIELTEGVQPKVVEEDVIEIKSNTSLTRRVDPKQTKVKKPPLTNPVTQDLNVPTKGVKRQETKTTLE